MNYNLIDNAEIWYIIDSHTLQDLIQKEWMLTSMKQNLSENSDKTKKRRIYMVLFGRLPVGV